MDFRPDEDNPFASPQSLIGSRASETDFESDPETESTRLYYLSHESAIKSVGLLGYLGALVGFFFAITGILGVSGLVRGNAPPPGVNPEMYQLSMWVGIIVLGGFGTVSLALGFGLRGLQVWARWVGMVALVLSILYFLLTTLGLAVMFGGRMNIGPVVLVMLVGIAIQAYLFYLLVVPRSGMVFSSEYRLVIQRTPEIICQSSLLVKILIGLTVALLSLLSFGIIAEMMQ